MSAIDDLRSTVARLRAPDGCPWDREQTHQTLTRCLIDECSELLDTIDRSDWPHMREELGDVLVQVVFHAQLAAERGDFDFDAVARDINEKLVRRHPHVFIGGKLDTSDQVMTLWEQIKAGEKKAAGRTESETKVFKELPPRLPALMLAEAVWKQIQKKKLPAAGAVDVARVQVLGEKMNEAEAGRRLFELAAACQASGVDPENALRLEAARVMREIETKAATVKA
ncbi:MAG: MazG family protein [Opitutaceae bacterium]|jgi:XTP/dITP diphosphohydrolase/tetrapyrrole methylase family protein/MazG family protein